MAHLNLQSFQPESFVHSRGSGAKFKFSSQLSLKKYVSFIIKSPKLFKNA